MLRFLCCSLVASAPLVVLSPRPTAPAIEGHRALAAPWAIIAHGPRLKNSITLANWQENQRLFLAMPGPGVPTASRALQGRPYLELALFWGPAWEHLKGSPEAVARLQPEQANQRAWLFLADGPHPAAVVLNPPTHPALSTTVAVRVVGVEGLAVLKHHGVPVELTR